MIPAIALGLGLAAHMIGASASVATEVIRAGDTVTAANQYVEGIVPSSAKLRKHLRKDEAHK